MRAEGAPRRGRVLALLLAALACAPAAGTRATVLPAQEAPRAASAADTAPPFAAGADLSTLPEVEAHGALFHDSQGTSTAPQLLRRHGFNWMRLRLWHSPDDGRCGLPEVVAMAKRAKAAGFRLLLDLHYSDTWADPGKQALPRAWTGLSQAALEDSVRGYTRGVLQTLRAAGAPPDMVQAGNEIGSGMLWDAGRVGGKFDTPAQWRNLGGLLRAALGGVREGAGPDARVRTLIHVDQGANAPACRWFFDRLARQGVEFDAIGVSFYPWWHGELPQLRDNVAQLAAHYGKDVYVVEAAYPWTLQAFDSKENLVGSADQLHRGYPATREGQAAFIGALARAVRAAPGGRGVFYWGGEWVAAPLLDSPWENAALFDNDGALLPAADSLGAYAR